MVSQPDREYSARIVPPPRTDGALPMEDPTLVFPAGGGVVDAIVRADPVSGAIKREWYARAATEGGLRSLTEAIAAGWPGVDIRPPGDGEDLYLVPDARRIVLALRPKGGKVVPVAALTADAVAESNAPLAAATPGPGALIITRMVGQAATGISLPTPPDQDVETPRASRAPWLDPQFVLLGLVGFLLYLALALGVYVPSAGTLDFAPLRPDGDLVWSVAAPYTALAIAVVAVGLRVRGSRSWRRLRPAPLSDEDLAAKRGSMLMHVSHLTIGVAGPDTPRDDLYRAVCEAGQAGLQRAGPADWELHEARFARTGFRPRRADCALLSAREAGALFPGPAPVAPQSGIEHVGARRRSPTPGHATRGVLIGRSDADPTLEIRQPIEVLTRHQVVVGKSGSGKSTLLRDLAVGAMDEDTVCIVDPHSSLARAVARSIPHSRKDRVHLIDFSDPDHLPVLNLLDVRLYPDVPRQVGRVIALLRLAYPGPEWGGRMQQIVHRSITTLMLHNLRLPREQQHSLLDVLRFVSDDTFRGDVFRDCGDETRREDWLQAYGNLPRGRFGEWMQPIDNKLAPLRDDPLARHILGRSASTIDLSNMLGGGVDCVIVDGGNAMLGNAPAQLICAALINTVLQLAMSPADTPLEPSRGLILIVDEATVLSAVDYETAYAQGRKYGVVIIAATQSLAQIDKIDPTLATVIGTNAGAHIVFSVGEGDADRLARELDVPTRELIALDDYRAIARWSERSGKGQAFTFETLPPGAPTPDAQLILDYIREHSRERYGRPVERPSRGSGPGTP